MEETFNLNYYDMSKIENINRKLKINLSKSIDDLILEQEEVFKTEFFGNQITGKENLINLYLSRDIKLKIDIIKHIDFTINKLYKPKYSSNRARMFIDDLIYDYRTGKLNISSEELLKKIHELFQMEYFNDKFIDSEYEQILKERFNKFKNNITEYYLDIKKFYNDLTLGELLCAGY